MGNPVARALCGRGILEVNRLCIRPDTPDALRWNAASMLYGWCAREAARQGWRKIITYTRADEPGTSLIAAGWKKDGVTRGRGWHSAGRARSNTNSWIGKVRWTRELAPETRKSIGERPGRHQTTAVASGRPTDFGDAGDWTLDPVTAALGTPRRTAAPSSSSHP